MKTKLGIKINEILYSMDQNKSWKKILWFLTACTIVFAIISAVVIFTDFKIPFINNDKVAEETVVKENTFIDDETTIEMSEHDKMILQEIDETSKFHLIIGSFKDYDNADQWKKIYPTAIILPITNEGFYRVSISRFDNHDIAIAKLRNYRKQYGQKSAWLLKE